MMLASALIAPVPGLSPEAYRRFLQNQIFFYPDQLLACGPYLIFYSGPMRDAYTFAKATAGNNNHRAWVQAFALGGTRINDTESAIFLSAQKLDDYFSAYMKKHYADPNLRSAKANEAYAIVWGGPSELLAQRNFMKAATVVCGASPHRVFVVDEMRPLLENSINRYTYERTQAVEVIPKLTADQKNKKKAIIQDFKLEALYTTQPQSWTCSLPAGTSTPTRAPILDNVHKSHLRP